MEKVKVISGKYKGYEIPTPGAGTHPMGSREKNALFNMISGYLPEAEVLDAYAGSGALGIEAVSRGAREVVFVEHNPIAMHLINQTCMLMGIPEEQVAFYRGSVSAFHKKFVRGEGVMIHPIMAEILETFPKKVDIILADPPYDDFNGKEISRLANNYLKKGGILALSHPGEAPAFAGLELLSSTKHARAHISVYVKK